MVTLYSARTPSQCALAIAAVRQRGEREAHPAVGEALGLVGERRPASPPLGQIGVEARQR